MPRYARPSNPIKSKRGQPEYHLSCAVNARLSQLHNLGLLRCVFFHVANEASRTERQKILGWRMGVKSGCFDWCFLWADGCGMIELKTAKPVVKDNQEVFAGWMAKHGVRHGVANSVAMVEGFLIEWGALRA